MRMDRQMEVKIEPAIKPRICVLGGTGFVGEHLTAHLAELGFRVRVPTRRPVRHRALGVLPRAEVIQADVHDPSALEALLRDCDAVVNLVAILNEDRRGDFHRVHVALVEALVEACHRTGIRRLIHMSALNAGPDGPSKYLRTKGEGEALAHNASGLSVTSFRPSVIFGPGDHLFNRFATLLQRLPLVFPVACPSARLSPVHVGDVVRSIAAALTDPATIGQRYELCGPRVMTLEQIVRYTANVIGSRRRIVPLGDSLSRLQARILGRLPGRLFTWDNYLSLSVPGTCDKGFPAVFGIEPTAVEAAVPLYLGRLGRRTRLAQARRTARRTPN